MLSPVVNLANDLRWGRVEETYGEDPVLSSRMGVAFVCAFEKAGIIATPKHFIANFGEGGRDSYPIDFSTVARRDVLSALRGGDPRGTCRSVMSAYNSVDGSPATQNRSLLTDKLQARLGFSRIRHFRCGGDRGRDGAASHRGDDRDRDQGRARGGTRRDLSSSWPQHRPYLDAFRSAGIPDSVIDSAVARVLRAKFELGLFEHPYVTSTARRT